jgi:hypothetical protein
VFMSCPACRKGNMDPDAGLKDWPGKKQRRF